MPKIGQFADKRFGIEIDVRVYDADGNLSSMSHTSITSENEVSGETIAQKIWSLCAPTTTENGTR